jgi:hypothetical protein
VRIPGERRAPSGPRPVGSGCGARRVAGQAGDEGDRPDEARRGGDDERGLGRRDRDQQPGQQRPGDEHELDEHRVQRERAAHEVRAVAQQDGPQDAEHRRGRRARQAGGEPDGEEHGRRRPGPPEGDEPEQRERVDDGGGHDDDAPAAVDEAPEQRRAEAGAQGGGAGDRARRRVRAGRRAQEEQDRQPVDPRGQAAEQPGGGQRRHARGAQDLQVRGHGSPRQ